MDAAPPQVLRQMTALLNVVDLQRSVSFYTHALGFRVHGAIEQQGTTIRALLRCGTIDVILNESAMRPLGRSVPHSYADVVLYFRVDDAQRLRTRLLADRHSVSPLEQRHDGSHEFTMRDPDGYELAFASERIGPSAY
jgi:catechol 2,3-dioxygenase-like lactoylglutathione lyase family enzyme